MSDTYRLQKQVDVLQGMVDKESKKAEEMQHEIREEVIRELSGKMNQNADIATLREEYQRREETTKRLCAKARDELMRLRNEKASLEDSLARSIQYIQDMKHSQASLDTGVENAIEIVATPREAKSSRNKNAALTLNDIDDFCAPFLDATPDPKSCNDIGSELDQILSSIEAQLKPKSW